MLAYLLGVMCASHCCVPYFAVCRYGSGGGYAASVMGTPAITSASGTKRQSNFMPPSESSGDLQVG